jgi:hypothetical protein
MLRKNAEATQPDPLGAICVVHSTSLEVGVGLECRITVV